MSLDNSSAVFMGKEQRKEEEETEMTQSFLLVRDGRVPDEVKPS